MCQRALEEEYIRRIEAEVLRKLKEKQQAVLEWAATQAVLESNSLLEIHFVVIHHARVSTMFWPGTAAVCSPHTSLRCQVASTQSEN